MPKGEKAPTPKKSAYVKFEQQEDIALFEKLTEDAKAKRYDVGTHILLFLLQNYTK